MGISAVTHGVATIAKHTGYSYQRVRYWKLIVERGEIKPLPGYGNHYRRLNHEQQQQVTATIRVEIRNNPTVTLNDMVARVRLVHGIQLGRTTVWRILKAAGLTKTRIAIIQRQKFTEVNAIKYTMYVQAMTTIDREKLYFLDEASFNPRFLFCNKGWGPKGKSTTLVNQRPLGERACTTTILTSIRNGLEHPIFHQIRQGTNTRWDFIQFLTAAINARFLQPNSIVVLDNARIHTSFEVAPFLAELYQELHILFMFLPPYSPELNSAELCFASCKAHFRKNRHLIPDRNALIAEGFDRITVQEMRNYYAHCIECRFEGKQVMPRVL